MKNVEVYRFSGNYYFINNDNKQEGKIILGTGGSGNEEYKYVSHLEECENLSEEEQDLYVAYLENNFDLIINAKEL